MGLLSRVLGPGGRCFQSAEGVLLPVSRTHSVRREVVGNVVTVGRWVYVTAVPELVEVLNHRLVVRGVNVEHHHLLVDVNLGRGLTRTISDALCNDFLVLAWCLER